MQEVDFSHLESILKFLSSVYNGYLTWHAHLYTNLAETHIVGTCFIIDTRCKSAFLFGMDGDTDPTIVCDISNLSHSPAYILVSQTINPHSWSKSTQAHINKNVVCQHTCRMCIKIWTSSLWLCSIMNVTIWCIKYKLTYLQSSWILQFGESMSFPPPPPPPPPPPTFFPTWGVFWSFCHLYITVIWLDMHIYVQTWYKRIL